jgi:hypothetical protein
MRHVAIAALAFALAAGAAQAASPFDGTWVDDLDSQTGVDHVDVYLVAGGTYHCDSCVPPRAYPADGVARPVAGDPGVVSESVRVAGPRSIVTRIVGPDMIRETTMTVAADDRTATYVSLDDWPGRASGLRTEYLARRIKPAPPGAHPVSGSWQGVRYTAVPEEYRSITLIDTAEGLSRSSFRRGRYTARYGGPPAPIEGVTGGYQVEVGRPDPNTRTETILLAGKPLTERTFRLSPDGQAMETTVKDLAGGGVFRATSHRRPPKS